MKAFPVPVAVLILTMVLAAGCTTSLAPAAPVPTAAGSTASLTAVPSATAALGGKYLEKKYSFTSEKDTYTEPPFRVTNEPWGIELTVNPTNEDPQYTWFEITLTNLDTGLSETYGYGRTYGFEKYQFIPMHNSGPYTVELKGNRVSVNVNIAKIQP